MIDATDSVKVKLEEHLLENAEVTEVETVTDYQKGIILSKRR